MVISLLDPLYNFKGISNGSKEPSSFISINTPKLASKITPVFTSSLVSLSMEFMLPNKFPNILGENAITQLPITTTITIKIIASILFLFFIILLLYVHYLTMLQKL